MSCINYDIDAAIKENMNPCKGKALQACLSM